MHLLLGVLISIGGSILPSYLNMSIVKYRLKCSKIETSYFIGGLLLILSIQAFTGGFLASVLMKKSEYISILQKVGVVVLMLLSVNFFITYFKSSAIKKQKNIALDKAFKEGIILSLLNVFAIPFYFTTTSFLINYNIFEFSFVNLTIFSVGSVTGSCIIYGTYAMIAKKMESKLDFLASKMNLILGVITGSVGIGNLFYLY